MNSFLKNFAEKDRMGSLMGIRWISVTADECICEYTVSEKHFNPNGILHGGALYAAMDSCQGAFVHFNLDQAFKSAATGTSTIKYLAPVQKGKVRIRTWLKVKQGRKIFVQSSATDEAGLEVAILEEIWIGILN